MATRKTKRAKPVMMWAVVDHTDEISAVYWIRPGVLRDFGCGTKRVARVEVREVPRKRKPARKGK